jgi:hypothetical protein
MRVLWLIGARQTTLFLVTYERQKRDGMTRRVRRRLFLGIAAAAVLAGATAAVVMAAQPSAPTHAHHGKRQRHGKLATAAAYLGLSETQLRSELQAGKSLAEIANATPGKSEAGLIQTLEAADHQKLAAEVNEIGGPHGGRADQARRRGQRAGRQGRALAAAASYLGVSAKQLRHELRSGTTLAQVTAATSGKSEAGLIEALVAASRAGLAARVASGELTQKKADEILPQLSRRVSAEVKRARHRHAGSSARATR